MRDARQHMPDKGSAAMPLYLGLDVGSISADLVVMTKEGEILQARY